MARRWFEKWFPPLDPEEDGLTYWRERILFGLLAGGLALSPIAVIPSVVLILKRDLWMLAAVNIGAFFALVYLLFSARPSFFIRALGLIVTFYAIALGVLTNAGIFSGGPFWLFFLPIMTSLLLGWRAAGFSIFLNALILTVIGSLIRRQAIGTGLQFFATGESALATLGNFVLLNTGAMLVVSIMIHGLERVIRIQRQTADRLRHEIEERKRGVAALQESELKYRQIFENIQNVYYEASLDGEILEISPSIEKVSRYSREELIGRSLHDLYVDPLQQKSFMAAIIERQRVEDYEVTLKDKDGALHECSLVSSIVVDEQGRPVKLVGSLHDITARKQIEAERERLEATNIQLQKGESLGRMAGAVAHHFNNHMGVVMGNLEMAIEDAVEGSSQREALEEAMQGARRAVDVSKAMLIYLGENFSVQKVLDLSEVCRRCLPLLQAVLPDRVTLEADWASSHLWVKADANQVQQILMNLVANAVEATGEGGGNLRLATRRVPVADISFPLIVPADWTPTAPLFACLELSDNGQGIKAKDMEKIFDPFFTTKFVGRGLGLSVVLGIVKTWDGGIAVQSAMGRGTTFRIYLPLAEASATLS